MRPAGTDAVNWVFVINVVVSAVLFQFTTDLPENPLPFTVSVNAGPPAIAVLGLIVLMVGAAATVNVTAFDVTAFDSTVI
jgi:hypothetical protein